MKIAIIGLGRMGGNIALHLLEQGVEVVAYNRSKEKIDEVVKAGAIGAYSLEELAKKLTQEPRIVFLYVPAGEVTEEIINELSKVLPKGSIIVDGGNSFFKDSQRRYKDLKDKGFHFLDMGTSGGLEGARHGACLMVGGDEEIYLKVEPILSKIAIKDGYGYFGPAGAGHYVKMIHNAVEYGMIGAIAEGMNLISNYPIIQLSNNPIIQLPKDFNIDLAKVAKVWAHGSIVSGLLMNKTASAFAKGPQLEGIEGVVPYGETEKEMEWIATTGIPNPVIQASRQERVETRSTHSFIGKVIAVLRQQFGGHAIKSVESSK